MPESTDITVSSEGSCKSAFDAGEHMAQAICAQTASQASSGQTLQLVMGLFSGSMLVLQHCIGDDAVVELFTQFLAARDGGASSEGLH